MHLDQARRRVVDVRFHYRVRDRDLRSFAAHIASPSGTAGIRIGAGSVDKFRIRRRDRSFGSGSWANDLLKRAHCRQSQTESEIL